MKMQRTGFYAARPDLEAWLKDAEAAMPVKYYAAGLFETAEDITDYASFRRIPDFGEALSGQAEAQDRFLVVPRAEIVRIRKQPQRRSSKVFCSVAQEENRSSLQLCPGGILRGGQRAVIAGFIANIWKTEVSLALYGLFRGLLEKHFTAVGNYRVGPEALRLLKAGYRLTENIRFPKESDLVLPAHGAQGTGLLP